MFHSPIAMSNEPVPGELGPADAPCDTATLQHTLAMLAAGLDRRFVQAGATLADAIDVIDRVIAALDGIANTLDEHAAGAAVDSLDEIARHLAGLPDAQAVRAGELATLVSAGRTLNDHVMDLHQALRVLRIYGTNIKIAASGEPDFVDFVDGMYDRLTIGEEHLDGFLAKLKELMSGTTGVQQAERLLAGECVTVLPHVPQQLARAAEELRTYLHGLGEMATNVAVIARDVHQRIATVLGALQFGDITRQRLEHVVSGLEMLAARERAVGADPAVEAAVRAHIHALLSGQLIAVAEDFDRESGVMLNALRTLGPDTGRLLALMESQHCDQGRTVLHDLERGISDVAPVIARLGDAGDRSRTMVGVIADVVDDLTARLDGLRRVRLHVQDIATNTRLLCRRFGTTGKAVSVIATEVDAYAKRLGEVMEGVARPIRDLSVVSLSMRRALDADDGAATGPSLAGVLATIRAGCQRSESGLREGCDDARQFIDVLQTACADLTDEMGCTATIADIADRLFAGDATPPVPHDADAALRTALDDIARLYTMAQERVVHGAYLLPGMESVAAVVVTAPANDDDLFDDAFF